MPALNAMTEGEIDQALQAGFRYAFSLTHDRAEAEDLLQEACVSILGANAPWDKAYVFTTIRNRFIDRYRRKQKVLFLPLEGEKNGETFEPQYAIEGWDAPDYLGNGRLDRALAELRPEERETIYLAVVEGYTAQEIAGMTGRPRGTILSLLHRTRHKLRGVLAKAAPGGAGVEKLPRAIGTWRVIALAASISVVFLAAAIVMLRKAPVEAPRVADIGLSERLAGEVMRRHDKCIEEIPFQAEDLDRLIVQMSKIDFTARVPSRRGIDRMKVKGAHYCVLDGQIAIHAVLVDESGEIVSLFETKAGANMASLRSATHRMGRNEVELWQENGVLYAAAFAAPTT